MGGSCERGMYDDNAQRFCLFGTLAPRIVEAFHDIQ
jgi:hypothetical protein